ncbi:exonuclease SBCC [Cryptosporidium felis]|nr:exonuclease SBCC [Cryptosporidium felis]
MSKIPVLIRPTNLKKPSSTTLNSNLKDENPINTAHYTPASSILNATDTNTTRSLSSKNNPIEKRNQKIPRVAYLQQKSKTKSSSIQSEYSQLDTVNKYSKRTVKTVANNCVKRLDSSNTENRNLNTRNTFGNCLNKSLNIRQQKLISERELRLEKTKLKLEETKVKYNQEKMLSEVIESELKLNLEYLEDHNLKYSKEVEAINQFEKQLKVKASELDYQINNLKSILSEMLNINSIFENSTELKQRIMDTERTIKLTTDEITETEKSIKFYELENNDKINVESLKVPFNRTIEYALSLENLLQNDKLSVSQLQFKLHKFTKKPRFVCRIFSPEIPQSSKIYITLPFSEGEAYPNGHMNLNGERRMETEPCSLQINSIYKKSNGAKYLKVDSKNMQFSIGEKIIQLDKLIDFDETKRPSTLLLTDISKISSYISNIMECNNCITGNKISQSNKDTIIRRQSLLHSRIEIEASQENKLKDSDAFKNSKEPPAHYIVDIDEQKEVEIDVLLMINDLFNNIKLELSERHDSLERSKSHEFNADLSLSSIYITNIGPNCAASRQTFWGTNSGRVLSLCDGISKYSEFSKVVDESKKQIPGILHSIVHQIYQNINNSSLFSWRLSAKIIMQTPFHNSEESKTYNNTIKDPEKKTVFSGGLGGYYSSFENSSVCMNAGSLESLPVLTRFNEIPDMVDADSMYSSEIIYSEDFKNSDEFITEVYREIQKLSSSYLGSVNAYNFTKSMQIHGDRELQSCHIIIDLSLEALTGSYSISSKIVLADLFIEDDGSSDLCIFDYFSLVDGKSVENSFINNMSGINTEGAIKPLIYTIIHSTTFN